MSDLNEPTDIESERQRTARRLDIKDLSELEYITEEYVRDCQDAIVDEMACKPTAYSVRGNSLRFTTLATGEDVVYYRATQNQLVPKDQWGCRTTIYMWTEQPGDTFTRIGPCTTGTAGTVEYELARP